MSINGENDWKVVELRAQLAEAGQIYSEPVPEPTPPTICGENWITKHQYDSVAQQLLWVTTRAAELQARLHRKDSAISQAIMYLSIGQVDRAQQILNRGLLDL